MKKHLIRAYGCGDTVVIERPKVSLWFALRAAVLRLAVSQSNFLQSRSAGCRETEVEEQNHSMANLSRPPIVASRRKAAAFSGCTCSSNACTMRANPSLNRSTNSRPRGSAGIWSLPRGRLFTQFLKR